MEPSVVSPSYISISVFSGSNINIYEIIYLIIITLNLSLTSCSRCSASCGGRRGRSCNRSRCDKISFGFGWGQSLIFGC